MKGRTRSRRKISITPLIDVIFLLLLFFMLASSFNKFSEIEVSVASQSSAKASKANQTISLEVEPEKIRLNGDLLEDYLLVDALNKLTQNTSVNVIAVMPAKSISSQRLIDILSVLGGMQKIRIRLVGDN